MTSDDFEAVKNGFMLCLLGSDKPIIESLNPNPIDQQEALDNQFEGMTDEPFNYDDYQKARLNLLEVVNQGLTDDDKAFLISFEDGNPDWSKCCAGHWVQVPLPPLSVPDTFRTTQDKIKTKRVYQNKVF